MDSSFREEGSEQTQQNTKSSFMALGAALNIVRWLASLIKLTAEEQEQAGIHTDRLGDE